MLHSSLSPSSPVCLPWGATSESPAKWPPHVRGVWCPSWPAFLHWCEPEISQWCHSVKWYIMCIIQSWWMLCTVRAFIRHYNIRLWCWVTGKTLKNDPPRWGGVNTAESSRCSVSWTTSERLLSSTGSRVSAGLTYPEKDHHFSFFFTVLMNFFIIQ